jgi:hypothetical protein
MSSMASSMRWELRPEGGHRAVEEESCSCEIPRSGKVRGECGGPVFSVSGWGGGVNRRGVRWGGLGAAVVNKS